MLASPKQVLSFVKQPKQRVMKRFWIVVIAAAMLAAVGAGVRSQGQAPSQAPRPVNSKSDETLLLWNSIGNEVTALADDCPEDKYDFKVQKDERTFAENLLHI